MIFLLSGIACLFIRNITALILVSCILGIGAGMVIPLSTGLVVAYFTGEYRVRQLGYSSSINNLTLVLATALSGYLANIDWHLSFLVYTLPAVSLSSSRRSCIGNVRRPNRPPATRCATKRSIARSLVRLMALYFFITYAALTITFYAAFLVDGYHLPKAFSGVPDFALLPRNHGSGTDSRPHHRDLQRLYERRRHRHDRRRVVLLRDFPGPRMLVVGALLADSATD